MNTPIDTNRELLEPPAPTCPKCGREITTGLMAVFCPEVKDCALRGDEQSAEAIDFLREAWDLATEGKLDVTH